MGYIGVTLGQWKRKWKLLYITITVTAIPAGVRLERQDLHGAEADDGLPALQQGASAGFDMEKFMKELTILWM